jgi:hypothetical protein
MALCRARRRVEQTRAIVSAPTTTRHDHMVSLVQRMLDLHVQHAAACVPYMKQTLQCQITATDRHIDGLVYFHTHKYQANHSTRGTQARRCQFHEDRQPA